MLSFVQWLDRQTHRDDAVGELAICRLYDDGCASAVTASDVAKRMRKVRARKAYWRALDQAAQEYRQQVPSNVIPFIPRPRLL